MLVGILSFAFVLGTAILIHEIGHFIAARKFGVMCHEFAIGMGPIIFKKRKGETLYTVRALPLGGFVSMAMDDLESDIVNIGEEIGLVFNDQGEVMELHLDVATAPDAIRGKLITPTDELSRDLSVAVILENGEKATYPVIRDAMYIEGEIDQVQYIAPTDRRLESKPKLQRIIIMIAGAIMNFILAYAFVFIVGAFMGEATGLTNELYLVEVGSPAYVAGLEAGDVIVSYDGMEVNNGSQLVEAINSSDEVEIEFVRDGVVHSSTVAPNSVDRNGEMVYVIGISIVPEVSHSIGGTFRFAWNQFASGFEMIFSTLGMLFTGEAGVGDLSGPVGIATMTAQFAAQGILPLFIFASLINVNVGIFNLLPLPALDGGRIVFVVIEAIIGRPVDNRVEGRIHVLGLILFMILFVVTTFNDVLRLFG